VDFIAGTSIGAIVGGLYAAGLSPEEMDGMLTSTDWNDLFTDRPSRRHLSFRRKEEDLESLIRIEMGWKRGVIFPASLIAGDKLIFYLRKATLQTHGQPKEKMTAFFKRQSETERRSVGGTGSASGTQQGQNTQGQSNQPQITSLKTTSNFVIKSADVRCGPVMV
jgi:predicted acylesterase/phospholipase RssA